MDIKRPIAKATLQSLRAQLDARPGAAYDKRRRARLAKSIEAWRKHPGSYDIKGVDYPRRKKRSSGSSKKKGKRVSFMSKGKRVSFIAKK